MPRNASSSASHEPCGHAFGNPGAAGLASLEVLTFSDRPDRTDLARQSNLAGPRQPSPCRFLLCRRSRSSSTRSRSTVVRSGSTCLQSPVWSAFASLLHCCCSFRRLFGLLIASLFVCPFVSFFVQSCVRAPLSSCFGVEPVFDCLCLEHADFELQFALFPAMMVSASQYV
jgi:hypothetical protein